MARKHTWQQELEIVDRTMKAISGELDPQQLVKLYWDGIAELLPLEDYVALSRRGVEPPYFLVTRSSRFNQDINPWTHRDKLPRLTGGLLGELAYANKPVYLDNLPARLTRDDPGWQYLEGFDRLVALPQYDGGEALNIAIMLLKPEAHLDLSQIPTMHWHSSLFGRATQTLVLRNQLADALSDLDQELQTVGEIQRTLLPESLPVVPGFEFAAYYRTSARAGGDYYDFFPLNDGGLGMFIADVSGHGTPAAVLMAVTHAIAHAQPGTHTPPQSLLGMLNDQLMRSYLRRGMFVTAFYSVLDPRSRQLTYARAGHNPPRLVRQGRIIPLDAIGSLPLGILENERFDETTIALEPGDLIVFYTDGITEAMPSESSQGRRELFGTSRLDDVLLKSVCSSAQGCIDAIVDALNRHTYFSPPVDDQTLLIIRCL